MSTSGTGAVDALLLVVVLVASVVLTTYWLDADPAPRRIPVAAVSAWILIAVPSVAQLAVPGLYEAFRRDPDLIRDGQWWRIITSILVQDGGVLGTFVDLLALAVVAVPAFRLWGAPRGWILFLAGQVVFGLSTTAVFPSVGAGSLAATLTLASAAAGVGVMVRPRAVEWTLVAIVVVGGAILVAIDDATGFAILFGVLFGAATVSLSPPDSIAGRRAEQRMRPPTL
ncbi:hypothetical protein ABH922_000952 [Rhodococcus sp. 27YEA15]|uniref:rhomboid family intramembrane serine protease n=1 Tax=Rhodococcus sp. 27YEA15 TaxID=3156259 RepID=UPI003C7E5EFC